MLVIALSRLRRSRARCVMWVTQGRAGTLPPMSKRRLDTLLAERGLYESRSRAAAAVMAGDVRVGERPARKPGELVADDAELEVAAAARLRLARRRQAGQRARRLRDRPGGPPRARRGRLHRRLHATACSSAARSRVIALDVAYGELHWTLRQDPRVTVIERRNARALAAGRAALRARPGGGRRVVHLAHQGAAGGARLRGAGASTAWRWSSPSSRSAASAWARAGWCARPTTGARRWWPWPARARGARGGGARLRLLRACPGPAGNRESFVWLAEAGRGGAVGGPGGRGAEGRAVKPAAVDHGLHPLAPGRHRRGAAPHRRAGRARPGWRCGCRADEVEKHGLGAGRGVRRRARRATPTSRWCWAATARSSPHLRAFAGTRRAGVRRQLRRDRLPGHGRALGARGGHAARAGGRVRRDGAARAARGHRARATGSR